MKGKFFTLMCKYIALLWLVIAGGLYIVNNSNLTTEAMIFICGIGIIIANLGLPVDISKIINNWKGNK
jgi:hypothetical protein